MIVVSDSATLIMLGDLNRLIYLKNIFSTICLPPKVYKEISFKKDFKLPNFIKISKPKDTPQLQELKMLLDDRESEAIALAIEKQLPLIMDEKKGRKITKDFLQKAKDNNYRISFKLIDDMFGSLV